MQVLLTNDDGVGSPGIGALSAALSEQHSVWVVAPHKDRSGVSHSITFERPLELNRLEEGLYACSGSPADCITLALAGGIPMRPDIILSGINLGSNVGDEVLYSGTLAAAREGAMQGIPSVGISLSCSPFSPKSFDRVAGFVAKNLQRLFSLWREKHFISLNFPSTLREGYKISPTVLGSLSYQRELTLLDSKDPNQTVYSVSRFARAKCSNPQSDCSLIRAGDVSISLVSILPEVTRWEEPLSLERT